MGFHQEALRAALTFALALPLVAQAAPRTFVASTGNDANTATNCPVANPCQSFAAAYSVTNVGGEIIALDTAGYGSVTIANSVSIIAIQRAFVKVNASSTGITITGGNVFLSNIEVTGLGNASTTGISVTGGHLVLKDSALIQLDKGMLIVGTKVDIINTDILFNTTGILTNGTGADPFGTAGVAYSYSGATTEARIFGGNVIGNTTAYYMIGPGASAQASTSKVTILISQDSNVLTNTVGNAKLVDGISGTTAGCPFGSTGNECTATGIYSSANQNGSSVNNP
jgi:hypothetical protein